MKDEFAISVVIPVYNAAPFVRKAVESALEQPEVREVVLVEDRSPDNSLEICLALEKEFEKVKLYRHPNNENRGAAASRNLGVRMATNPYIAFLDADDYYLPARFATARERLAADPSADGVYDAIGLHIYSEHGRERYEKYKGKRMDDDRLITIRRAVPADELFDKMLFEQLGIFHANGITVKRELVMRAGLFDEDLNIVEDTVLWFKLAYHGRLVAGNLTEPVARQGIHDQNREPETKPILLYQKYERLFTYFLDKDVAPKARRAFFVRMLAYHPARKHMKGNRIIRNLELLYLAAKEIAGQPSMIARLI